MNCKFNFKFKIKLPFVLRSKLEHEQLVSAGWRKNYEHQMTRNLQVLQELEKVKLELSKYIRKRDAKGRFMA